MKNFKSIFFRLGLDLAAGLPETETRGQGFGRDPGLASVRGLGQGP